MTKQKEVGTVCPIIHTGYASVEKNLTYPKGNLWSLFSYMYFLDAGTPNRPWRHACLLPLQPNANYMRNLITRFSAGMAVLCPGIFLWSSSLLAGPAVTTPYIKVDQFGYFSTARKVAVIVDPQSGYNAAEAFSPGTGTNQYQLRRWSDDAAVFTGTLQVWNNGNTHAQSGDRGWYFDFSVVTTPGSYYVFDLANNVGSYRFDIGDNVYQEALKQSLRTFYYQRINFAKVTPYAGANWTDAAWYEGANQDRAARSRYDKTNPATARDLHGGWFDAGDQNKYTTFAQEPVLELLEAYRLNPGVFGDDLNIPESGNGIPDLLDEVKWELDFLKRMQDATGTHGFFLKVGVDNYNSVSPPSLDTRPRYWVGECTSATLSGAAMFALAGIVYAASPNPALQTYGNDLLTRAANAWARAQTTTSNFTTFQTNCDDQDIKSGDADQPAQRQLESAVIAAVYLYEATGNATYKNFVESRYTSVRPYVENYWAPYNMGISFALLRYASLPGVNSTVANNIRNQKAGMSYVFSINNYNAATDLYRSHMEDWAYHWGSNQVKSNAGNNNLDFITFGLNPAGHAAYREVAEQYLHWFHGVNPMGMVMLSNMYAYGAEHCVNEIYHAWFDNGTVWDNALTSPKGPAPGYVTGGPNKDFTVQSIVPPGAQPPQKAYKDWNAGFPENSWEISEPSIYNQAAYIRLLSRLITPGGTPTVAAPTNLSATAISASQINLTWTDNADNETAYEVERAASASGPWTSIAANLPANTTAHSATGLNAGATYYFRVRCANAGAQSAYSNTASATTQPGTAPPAAPSGLTANAGSSNTVVLRWTDNAADETAYKVERATASGGPWTEIAATLAANATNYTATGLNANTLYYFRVRCANAAGNSAYSNTANARTTKSNLPGAPSNLTAAAVSSSQINLSWLDNATNETAYKVERATSSGGPWTVLTSTLPANSTSYSATGLNVNTLYFFRVRCANSSGGNSAYSNTASTTTQSGGSITTLMVYDEALAADWADWSWSATNDFNNTSPVQSGTRSISTTYTAGWGGLSLRKGADVNTSAYPVLKFWVHGGSGANKSLVFFVQSTDGGPSSPSVAFTAVAGAWTEVTILMSQVGSPALVKRINFQNNSANAQSAIYFDNIRFESSGGALAWPSGGPTATEEVPVTSSSLQFFPNPSMGLGTLSFEASKPAEAMWVVTDLYGRRLRQGNVPVWPGKNVLPIDLSGLPAGVYLLYMEGTEAMAPVKIVKD